MTGGLQDIAERKIYATISTRYWWKGMRAEVRYFCRSCLVCASRKETGKKRRPPLQSVPVGGPFEMVGVDVYTTAATLQSRPSICSRVP